MSRQLGFLMEENRCTGCKACQIACKDKHGLGPSQNYRKVIEVEENFVGSNDNNKLLNIGYVSISCNHCMNPLCLEACPVDAIKKDGETGIVLIDGEKCIGCGRCMRSCPYDAIFIDIKSRKAKKCDFCMDSLKSGEKPACVTSCPVRALDFGDYEELVNTHGKCDYIKGLPKPISQPALVLKVKE